MASPIKSPSRPPISSIESPSRPPISPPIESPSHPPISSNESPSRPPIPSPIKYAIPSHKSPRLPPFTNITNPRVGLTSTPLVATTQGQVAPTSWMEWQFFELHRKIDGFITKVDAYADTANQIKALLLKKKLKGLGSTIYSTSIL